MALLAALTAHRIALTATAPFVTIRATHGAQTVMEQSGETMAAAIVLTVTVRCATTKVIHGAVMAMEQLVEATEPPVGLMVTAPLDATKVNRYVTNRKRTCS